MAIPKPKKSQNPENLELLKSDVASFASSLGLASSLPSSGFDDSDFRKTGPIKPHKSAKALDSKLPKTGKTLISNPSSLQTLKSTGDQNKVKPRAKTKKSPLEEIDPFGSSDKLASGKSKIPKHPLIKASSLSGQWYSDAAELEARVFGSDGGKVSTKGLDEVKSLVAEKKEVAERLLVQYNEDYEASRMKNRDMRLVETTVRSGTTVDRVSALTCLVEDNPIANMKSLDILLGMVTSKVGKRYAFTGFEALKELFLLRLLPDRKLKCLLQHPLDNLPESKDGYSLLLFWYWEECLKQRYERFIVALEEASKDSLPNLRDKAVKLVHSLLRGKAEQERRLLSCLVNKLGDPVRKTASSAGYYLSCLLSAHPNMKVVVIDEVDSFIFRPHVGLRSKYHAVNFLSQILLTKKGDGPKVAKRLVEVYFALFKHAIQNHYAKYEIVPLRGEETVEASVLISEPHDSQNMYKNGKKDKNNERKGKKKGIKHITGSNQSSKGESPLESNIEMDSRLLSALLTGVNRAFPFVASDEADNIVEVQTPILFKLVHSKNFNVGVQALMLLYQISSKNQIVSDRFYRALYSNLLMPSALHSSKPEMFLGLLVKAMKGDINTKRVAAFSKRLLQVSLQQPPQYACGCLFILSEVLKARPALWTIMLQKESLDEDLEHFEDIIEDTEEVTGIVPPGSSPHSINSVCKISNSNGAKTEVKSSGLQNGGVLHSEECYNSGGEDNSSRRVSLNTTSYGGTEQAKGPDVGSSTPVGYNPRHREPSYCNAERSSWWELMILASHVHPSVSTMARTLLSGANIVYHGDPLTDLSLIAFLDKFMEKKPKANQRAEGTWHGGSQIAPARKLDLSNHLIGEDILQLAEEEVPPEDVVFHKFYMNKTSSVKKMKKKKKKISDENEATEELLLDDGGDESDDDDEIDSMLGLGQQLPLEEAEGDYDYDDLDRVAEEDDDDLLGHDSDEETDNTADLPPLNELDGNKDSDGDDTLDMDFREGEADSDGDEEPSKSNRKRKMKSDGRSGVSPFASLEEYEHLFNDDDRKVRKRPKKSGRKKTSD